MGMDGMDESRIEYWRACGVRRGRRGVGTYGLVGSGIGLLVAGDGDGDDGDQSGGAAAGFW